jgi:transcriptional regulator with XRE-family HTH domain
MMHWTRTPLELAYDKVFEVFGITENTINNEELPNIVSAEQLLALEELEEVLKGVTKEELEKLEPADLFIEPAAWNENCYCPVCLLYDYAYNLQLVNSLLGELGKRAQVEKLAKVSAEVGRVVGIIDEIAEDYARGVFASKLKYLMDKKGITAKDVAAQLLVTPQTVSLWLNSKGYPNIPTLLALTVLLESSLDFLLRPDAVEVSLDEDTLHKSVGLSAGSSKVLKELVKKKNKDVLTTLNYIIETYNCTAESLLYAITDYFKLLHNSSLHMVSDEILADLDYEVKTAKTINDARAAVSSYVENQASMDYNVLVKGAAYDVDKALLVGIMEVLVKMKDKVEKDFYG